MTRTLIAALALVAASSAFAESPVVDSTPFVASKTRAEVTSEFLQSRAQTAALTGEDSGSAYLSARSPSVAVHTVAGQPTNAQ